jgi:hypothetical protein
MRKGVKKLKRILYENLAKINGYKKRHKREKNEALCRISSRIGSEMDLYIDSFL